jgi:type VI secretion system protein ImpL
MNGLLSGRLAVGAGAWLAFSVALWFAGDMLSFAGWRPFESAAACIVAIVAVGAAWLAWEFWRVRKAARENESLLTGLVGGSLSADSAERAASEIQLLRKRFEDALAVLRKARFRSPEGERRTVSQLPWYMFIGAPGSGKTTALLNAGLRFPLGDPRSGEQALAGVGGTRNCDWWFTDSAVLLDTAGRYTTQESDKQADAAAWLGFLELLKRFRARQPLNGVIVTVAISDLLNWNAEELARYARHVRERVSELYTRLGVRLPLYLMVTKTDLLAGFNEFFSEFDARNRAQVWGTTFDSTEVTRAPGARFDEEFARLERRLYALLPTRLQEERDLQRRAAVYRFPQQFRINGPQLSKFIDAAFGSGWSGEPPLLRGVYFTSGTQEGSPIDRVLGTLARSFNLERKVAPPPSSGKSYFLRRLLHEVIFGEAGLAGTDVAEERRLRFARFGAYAAFAALTLGLGAVWTASYFGNESLIAAAEAKAAATKRDVEGLAAVRPGEEARLIAVLNELRALRATAEGDDSWVLRAGFYQGGKLGAQASRAYRNTLRESLLGHLQASLERSLRDAPSPDALAGYVALHDEAGRDAQAVEKAALAAWKLPESARADLGQHLREALAVRPVGLPRARDDALIDEARRKLGGGGTRT